VPIRSQMILSVVIVSYNVKFFLEQCLSSLKKAVDGSALLCGQTEIFIIDNNSSDGTLDFLAPLYPGFRFIRNGENLGFAKANNQALPLCTGEFILFLNPDTILAEDSLDNCLSFFRITPTAGALGVHMIDGTGSYLKESKRGFPGPLTSFYKMTGLTNLFPHSKKFSSYYLGHLDEWKSHEIDIISGAFMMIHKKVLDKTGGFDERFFMYGEDIDLSYRISLAGYQNYYFAGTTILHFKGESTRKDLRYVKMFYAAMNLFMKKHFNDGRSSLQIFFLKSGVGIHRILTAFRLPFRKLIHKPPGPSIVFIRGDPNLAADLKRKLIGKKIHVTEKENDGEEIIYCEGPLQSWKSLISEIIKNKFPVKYKFHGAHTHAAVGSASSRYPGEILEI